MVGVWEVGMGGCFGDFVEVGILCYDYGVFVVKFGWEIDKLVVGVFGEVVVGCWWIGEY